MTSTCPHSHPPPDVGFCVLGGVLLTCDIYFKPDPVSNESVHPVTFPILGLGLNNWVLVVTPDHKVGEQWSFAPFPPNFLSYI